MTSLNENIIVDVEDVVASDDICGYCMKEEIC